MEFCLEENLICCCSCCPAAANQFHPITRFYCIGQDVLFSVNSLQMREENQAKCNVFSNGTTKLYTEKKTY